MQAPVPELKVKGMRSASTSKVRAILSHPASEVADGNRRRPLNAVASRWIRLFIEERR